jgi:hypothetical protein
MSIRDVEILEHVPEKGFLVKYTMDVSNKIKRRRMSYFNNIILDKDNNNKEIIEKIEESLLNNKKYK